MESKRPRGTRKDRRIVRMSAWRSEHHVLELLERAHFDDRGRRLGLERDFLLGERVDALARFDHRFAHRADFKQARQDELADGVLLEVRFDNASQAVEDGSHLLAAELGGCCDLVEDLGFAETGFDGSALGGHARGSRGNAGRCQGRREGGKAIVCGLQPTHFND